MAGTDYSENLFNDEANQRIMFYHEWSGKQVAFKAFDLSYSEAITNDWEEVALPRRINRAYTWSGVLRSISLGWSMPAWDLAEAQKNLSNCTMMVRMMYPMVDSNSQITGGNPIWHLGLMNWIHHSDSEMAASKDRSTMLAGFPTNFNYNIVPTDGFLYDGTKAYPKNIKVSMGYTVLMDDTGTFGWSDAATPGTSTWKGPKHFPWTTEIS
jgi:hypothetical protein|tara:strand:- start:440 stop:1072 length:633 start_codon:yes stop_codon:yes gene_type:complete